jgi:ABC-type antimicrobial peptide transport system permease subunit
MLSDAEEKTYEFGMLRALGFNTNNLMATIII